MKRVNKLIIVLITLIMCTGMTLTSLALGDDRNNGDSILTGWQQYHISHEKLWMDKVHVDFYFNATVDKKIGISLAFDTDILRIKCCRAVNNEYAWCNLDEQHEGC